MNTNHWLTITFATLTISSSACKKDNPTPAEPEIPVSEIYVAGFESVGGTNIVKYWKNGVATNLTNQSNGSGYALDMKVVGNDVYVAGWEFIPLSNGATMAEYWKNGVGVALTDGSKYNVAEAIAVSGNNVYVAGYQNNGSTGNTAKYWKNGVVTDLTDGSQNAQAHAIALSGSAVYIAGSEGASTTYWKNGVPTRLNNARGSTEGYAIFLKQ